jgi:hypothetical protein
MGTDILYGGMSVRLHLFRGGGEFNAQTHSSNDVYRSQPQKYGALHENETQVTHTGKTSIRHYEPRKYLYADPHI